MFCVSWTGEAGSADSVAQMMEVARRAVDGIRFREPEPRNKFEIDLREEQFKDFRKAFDKRKSEGLLIKGKKAIGRPAEGRFLTPKCLGDRVSLALCVPEPRRRETSTVRKTPAGSENQTPHRRRNHLPEKHLGSMSSGARCPECKFPDFSREMLATRMTFGQNRDVVRDRFPARNATASADRVHVQ